MLRHVYASIRIKAACLWQQGAIVHTSQAVWHAFDIRLAVHEVINISSSQLVSGVGLFTVYFIFLQKDLYNKSSLLIYIYICVCDSM